jgi:hypothetical protein
MAVEAPGRRGERVAETPLQRLDSIREVSAWFGSGDGVTAIALRPRKHKGHEQDEVSAAVLGDAPWPPITDPRLSTTYSTDGRPTRFNLELWSEDPEHFPRRVAGEVIGAGAEVSSAGWQLRAELLQCHSRGEEGPGVYVVGRPA